jgi:hypothetical protein
MPKAKKGILLITDVATKIYLLSLAEKDKFVITAKIDDRTLFIEEAYLDFVKEKVQEFKDKHSWERPANAPERFND